MVRHRADRRSCLEPAPRSGGVQDGKRGAGPNVYLIWLDGYPRDDWLIECFGFDNRPFLDALEDRGFAVAEHGQSQYPSTIQTMATMMQMRPLEELVDDECVGSNEQHRRLSHLINSAPVPATYKAAGYTTYSIVSPAPGHDSRAADVVLDRPWLSEFEAHLFNNGILRPVIPVSAMHRADILDTFDYLEASARTSPRFVLAHVLKPHDPTCSLPMASRRNRTENRPETTLARQSGARRSARRPDPLARRACAQRTSSHHRGRPSGVIVVFSDHGLRRDPTTSVESFRTLFASRNHAFADDTTTSGLLPELMAPQSIQPVSGGGR